MRRYLSAAIGCLLVFGFLAPNRADAGDERAILGPTAVRLDGGHYRITLDDGTYLFTHGPDPVPNHGGSIGTTDPQRAPVCGTDYYQHVLYGRLNGSTDRYSTVKPSIQAAMKRINAVLNESSVDSGNRPADYKVKCDGSGDIQVDSFTASGLDFNSVVDGARAAGYNLSNVDYTIFFDAQPQSYCGVGSYRSDERLISSNSNNTGGGYAISYNQCWNNETPMHENGHNQGAVQYGAPYSTGSGGHCYDENDVMCYSPDGGDLNQGGTINRCSDKIHFDCGNDTYFDSAPETGEYLASHWNIGSSLNRFIVFGAPLSGPPKASLGIQCSGLACAFTDNSTDDGTITSWSWNFGDGFTSTQQHPSHNYAGAATHLVSLSVTDNTGMTSSASQTLTVPNNGDPDPATPTLSNGSSRTDRNGSQGTWKYYKIQVPQGRPSVNFTLQATACTLFFCNPDLDLYIRPGQRPDDQNYACRSIELSNQEVCTIASPAGGYWYIGVYTFFGAPNPLADLSAVNFTINATY